MRPFFSSADFPSSPRTVSVPSAMRAWLDEHHRAVQTAGRVAVPDAVQAVCIDYNGVARANGGRPCAGAYRYPEGEAIWVVAL